MFHQPRVFEIVGRPVYNWFLQLVFTIGFYLQLVFTIGFYNRFLFRKYVKVDYKGRFLLYIIYITVYEWLLKMEYC